MHISSPAFSDGEMIPKEYSADGNNVSPPLQFGDVPPETKSLALIVEDPDAPRGTFTHWIVWGMKAERRVIDENSTPPEAVELNNGLGKTGYFGPRPPSGTHRYFSDCTRSTPWWNRHRTSIAFTRR